MSGSSCPPSQPLFHLSLYPGQRPPEGVWRTWLLIGGEGAGKKYAGAAAVIAEALADPEARILIVGPTEADIRRRQIGDVGKRPEPSSILSLAPPDFRPTVRLGRRTLEFPNGAQAHWAPARDPDQLRGYSCSFVWANALHEWRRMQALEECRRATRVQTPRMRERGLSARLLLTARAVPTALLRNAVEESEGLVRSRLSTFDNAAHLDERYVAGARRLQHTLRGRRDFGGELFFSAEEYEASAPPTHS